MHAEMMLALYEKNRAEVDAVRAELPPETTEIEAVEEWLRRKGGGST